MINQIILAVLLLCTIHTSLLAQTKEPLRGMVTAVSGEPLIGASVLWKGTGIGTAADTAGRFTIQRMDTTAILLIRMVGVNELEMEILPSEQDVWIEVKDLPESVLNEVRIAAKQWDNSVSTLGIRNIESINSKELRKAPCCNLSESFETNNSVDVTYPNAITGVREVQLLGLRSTYGAFLLENRLAMKGIAAPYAFEFIPGTWLSGIQIAKGAGTVLNSYEGISGQINVELQRPDRDKPVFFNLFSNSGQRGEANLHLNKAGKNGLSHGVLLHTSLQKSPFDHNNDNFYDMLDRSQYNAMYRMIFDKGGWCGQVSAQAFTDRRDGGQIKPSSNGSLFGFDMQNDRVEVTAKFGKMGLGGKPYRQIGNIFNVSMHDTEGTVGPNLYQARQKSLYFQSIYATIIGNTNHKIELAPIFSADIVTEKLNDLNLSRKEIVAGVMGEYTYQRPNLKTGNPDLAIVLGLRADMHSLFGLLVSPRSSIKYNFNDRAVIRASVGRGFHSPYIIPENISWLATNKAIDFAQVTHAESAWNYGINYTQSFHIANRASSLAIDLYRTDFERQLLIDQETDLNKVQIYYNTDAAWAQTALATFQINPFKGFDVKLAWKIQDVQSTYADGIIRWQPLLPRHRGLLSLDYTTPNERWVFNTTAHVVGTQRLPNNEGIPHLHGNFPSASDTYAVFAAQVTRKWKTFELYLGGENLGSYTQHHLIISANDPSSKYFNASQVYAPAFGRMAYLGLRWWRD
jgi:outer membrane receptor for ferrienterochelin and colicins